MRVVSQTDRKRSEQRREQRSRHEKQELAWHSRSVSASVDQSFSLCRSCRHSSGTLDGAAFLPVSALLQGVDDLARHVILIVLGEHARGSEDAVRAQLSFGNGPLPLAKKVGKQPLIDDRDVRRTIC